jgi:hypothetical protein
LLVWDYEKSPGEDSTPGALSSIAGYRGLRLTEVNKRPRRERITWPSLWPMSIGQRRVGTPCLTSAALTCSTGETLVGAALAVTNVKKPPKTGDLHGASRS